MSRVCSVSLREAGIVSCPWTAQAQTENQTENQAGTLAIVPGPAKSAPQYGDYSMHLVGLFKETTVMIDPLTLGDP